MPLSDEVRRELAAIEPRKQCDRLAELSGLFHTAGSLHLRRRGEFSVHLDVAEAAVARRAFGLLRSFGVEAEIRTYSRRAFDRATRYQIHVPGGERSLAVLHRAGVLSGTHAPLEAPPKGVVGRACCRHAYVRGAFLGGGSVSGPRSPHLEIRTASRAGADLLVGVAAQDDVVLRVQDRARYSAVYAKGAEAIADALALAGAGDTALALDEHAVVAEARARANRIANADHANLVRSSRAAHRQIVAIRRLEARGRLARLAPSLQEIAELRQRHPSASLRELAAKCRPPATKAAVHRRLSRLVVLAGDDDA
ncbi:MAG: DNA-binding protein WhiA [Verrucomicrobiota bacterium]